MNVAVLGYTKREFLLAHPDFNCALKGYIFDLEGNKYYLIKTIADCRGLRFDKVIEGIHRVDEKFRYMVYMYCKN